MLIVSFVCGLLFFRRLPGSIQSVLFFIVLLLEIALITAGWWYYVRDRKANGVANWRKSMALADSGFVGTAYNYVQIYQP